MTLLHCIICDDSIDTDSDAYALDDEGEPLCSGCHDSLESGLDEDDDYDAQDAAPERDWDHWLDDPRHTPGNYH